MHHVAISTGLHRGAQGHQRCAINAGPSTLCGAINTVWGHRRCAIAAPMQVGGTMVFSTCTINPQENEGNVRQNSSALSQSSPSLPSFWNVHYPAFKSPIVPPTVPPIHIVPP